MRVVLPTPPRGPQGKGSLFFQRQLDLFPLPIHLLGELLPVPDPTLPTPHLEGALSHELREGEPGEGGLPKSGHILPLGSWEKRSAQSWQELPTPVLPCFLGKQVLSGLFFSFFRLKILPGPKGKVSGNIWSSGHFSVHDSLANK